MTQSSRSFANMLPKNILLIELHLFIDSFPYLDTTKCSDSCSHVYSTTWNTIRHTTTFASSGCYTTCQTIQTTVSNYACNMNVSHIFIHGSHFPTSKRHFIKLMLSWYNIKGWSKWQQMQKNTICTIISTIHQI